MNNRHLKKGTLANQSFADAATVAAATGAASTLVFLPLFTAFAFVPSPSLLSTPNTKTNGFEVKKRRESNDRNFAECIYL